MSLVIAPTLTLILITLTITAANGSWHLSEDKQSTAVKVLTGITSVQGGSLLLLLPCAIYHFCQRRRQILHVEAEFAAINEASQNYGATKS